MKRLILLGMLLSSASADPFPELHNSEPDPSAAPMPAADALAVLSLPDGFTATLFAAEPMVQNPIGMAWDGRGRLWIAENFTYAERRTRFDLALRDRVLILEDTDWDGAADTRTVFTDQVQMLTSVETGRGGVWLMCPPRLLFVPDRDGDDKPDAEPEVMLDGFTVGKSNYHNFANGLRWGPDGWLYGRCGHSCPGRLGLPGTPDDRRLPIKGGIWRFHPTRRVVEVLTHGTTNPWGHDWDRHGELFFVNSVNGHLWHGIPGAHFKESWGADPNPLVYERLDRHTDHWHYDRGGKWQDSRAGKADKFGGGHAHIGTMVYQAGQWPPAYRDRLLTLNLHGRRTNVERLERHGSGYIARHQDDVFRMGDPWFRGIDIQQGPDGSAFVIDWSDTGECHEHNGVHRTSGRVYRISHGTPAPPVLDLSLEAALTHTNAWHARRRRGGPLSKPVQASLDRLTRGGIESFEGRDPSGAPHRGLVAVPGPTFVRLRALWHLHAADAASPALLRDLLDDNDEHLRVWAIRLLTDKQPIDTMLGPRPDAMPPPLDSTNLERFLHLARADRSGLVRLTLASTLQRLPLTDRARLGTALATRAEDADDHNLPAMVWYGLHPLVEHDPKTMLELVELTTWPDLLRWTSRAFAARVKARPAPVDALLRRAATDPDKSAQILQGFSEAFKGWRVAPRPAAWSEVSSILAERHPESVRELGALFGDRRAMTELTATVFDADAGIAARESALRTLIANRPPDLRATCEKLLGTPGLNQVAVRGLAGFDDPAIGERLAANYRELFGPGERAPVVDTLASRPAWARAMLEQMAAGTIPKQDLTPFHARQILAHNDKGLHERLRRVWGEARAPTEAKRRRIETLRRQLGPAVLAKADPGRGRRHFQTLCAACHRLYGEGGEIGPDLTGSGRADLGYLLENLVDPSAVVGPEYQLTVVELRDGRVITGAVSTETETTLSLRMINEESTVEKRQIAKRRGLPVSLMPEAMLSTLEPDERRDLIAYLMHPKQVPAATNR